MKTRAYGKYTPGGKKCTKCKISKSLDDFYNKEDGKNGKSSSCKECESKRRSNGRKVRLEKPKPKNIPNDSAFCSRCEKIKKKVFFRVSNVRKNGVQCYCRDCDNERRKLNRLKKKIPSK